MPWSPAPISASASLSPSLAAVQLKVTAVWSADSSARTTDSLSELSTGAVTSPDGVPSFPSPVGSVSSLVHESNVIADMANTPNAEINNDFVFIVLLILEIVFLFPGAVCRSLSSRHQPMVLHKGNLLKIPSALLI